MNDEALELELAKARIWLDRVYMQRGRRLADLSEADLHDAYMRGTEQWWYCRTNCQLLDEASSELRLRGLEPPRERAGAALIAIAARLH